MPSGAGGRRQAGSRSDNYISWAPQQGARSPSAMPLNKAAAGPKMNGYHGENATGAVNGPLGRNDGVLYGRMPGGENHNHPSLWSGHGQMNMRHGGLGDMRMQGLHALQPPISDDGLVEGIDAMQLGASGGDAGMSRSHRPKLSDGERQEETEDDLFAMYRFKVVPCSKQFVHDWKECSFAHEGETARRRHPSLHTATPCPDFKATKSCPREDRCSMAHGPWEAGLHPDAFKTNLCAYGKGCQRRMCFFAHDGAELRTPQPGSSSHQHCPPVSIPHAGAQVMNSWQNQGQQQQQQQQHQHQHQHQQHQQQLHQHHQHHQHHQQHHQQGPARHHMPFSNPQGAAHKGGAGHQRGRSSINPHIAKSGLVPGPADPNLAMGFEDTSLPADPGGIGPKAWAPVAQGPGAVAGAVGQGAVGQLSGGAAAMGTSVANMQHGGAVGIAGMQQGNPRQAGRGLNKPISNPAVTPGAPNSMGPGGKPNNSRRPNNHNMRGGYNASRMAGSGPAGAQTGAVANPGGGGGGGQGEEIKVPITPPPPNGTPLLDAGRVISPEWVGGQDDTSWVDKLLDIDLT